MFGLTAVRRGLCPILMYCGLALGVTAGAAEVGQGGKEVNSYDPTAESMASLRAAFPGLTFLGDGMPVVAFDPKEATVINRRRSELPKSDPLFVADDFEADDTVLLKTKLGPKQAAVYVLFTEGPSADPEFYFIQPDKPGKIWAEVSGTALALTGNDAVYAANRFDTTFTRRAKYLIEGNRLVEVPQPYFYVGLKTHTLAPVTLYVTPDVKQQVARLPKGAEVEVLLTNGKSDKNRTLFLLKTPFGLTGWAWIDGSQYESTVIDGISFWGD